MRIILFASGGGLPPQPPRFLMPSMLKKHHVITMLAVRGYYLQMSFLAAKGAHFSGFFLGWIVAWFWRGGGGMEEGGWMDWWNGRRKRAVDGGGHTDAKWRWLEWGALEEGGFSGAFSDKVILYSQDLLLFE